MLRCGARWAELQSGLSRALSALVPPASPREAISYELGAAQILQAEDPGLFISITMPTTTTGANYFGHLPALARAALGWVALCSCRAWFGDGPHRGTR